jgi:hypothetical protein
VIGERWAYDGVKYILAWMPSQRIILGSAAATPDECLRKGLPYLRRYQGLQFIGSARRIMDEMDLVARWLREAHRAHVAYVQRQTDERRAHGAALLRQYRRCKVTIVEGKVDQPIVTNDVPALVRGPWAICRSFYKKKPRQYALVHVPSGKTGAYHQDRRELAVLAERLNALGDWSASDPKELIDPGRKIVREWYEQLDQ